MLEAIRKKRIERLKKKRLVLRKELDWAIKGKWEGKYLEHYEWEWLIDYTAERLVIVERKLRKLNAKQRRRNG